MVRGLACTLLFVLGGCGSGGGGNATADATPTLVFLSPEADVEASRGGRITIEIVSNDPSDAVLEVFAEPDSGLATNPDPIPIATGVDDDGNGQTVAWDTTGVALGTYRIVGRLTAPGGTPVVVVALGLVTLANRAYAQAVEGAHVRDIASFSDGSVVVAGSFTGTVVFDDGGANETVLETPDPSSAVVERMFLARYDNDGALVWARRDGGTRVTRIVAGTDGSCAVLGDLIPQQGTRFVFGEGEPTEASFPGARFGPGARFVGRYGDDGSFQWARRFSPDAVQTRSYGLAAGRDGAVVLAGSFIDTLLFGDGEPNETLLVADAGEIGDIFVVAYEPDGDLAWARTAGGPGREILRDVAVFPDGTCGIVGDFSHITTFGLGEPGETSLVSRGNRDIFVARFAEDGMLVDASRFGGTDNDVAYGLVTDPDGSCVILGSFDFAMRLGEGGPNELVLSGSEPGNPFMARFSADGGLVWGRVLADRTFNFGFLRQPGLSRAQDGSLIVAANFSSVLTLAPGEPQEVTFPALGAQGFSELVARFEHDGTLAWARAIPTNSGARGIAAAAFDDGSAAIITIFNGPIVLGEGDPNETTVQGASGFNLLLARFNADGDF